EREGEVVTREREAARRDEHVRLARRSREGARQQRVGLRVVGGVRGLADADEVRRRKSGESLRVVRRGGESRLRGCDRALPIGALVRQAFDRGGDVEGLDADERERAAAHGEDRQEEGSGAPHRYWIAGSARWPGN